MSYVPVIDNVGSRATEHWVRAPAMGGYYRPERWTVQVLPGRPLSGFGAAAPAACGPNETRNPKTGTCFCNLGFEENDSGACVPVDPTKPCKWDGQMRTTIDKKCECPPGMTVDPSPSGTGCVRMRWFPNCVDASGNKVPNCAFGFPLKETAIAVGAGALLGFVLGKLL